MKRKIQKSAHVKKRIDNMGKIEMGRAKTKLDDAKDGEGNKASISDRQKENKIGNY